ncbi:MAG: hypothetical protein LBI67_00345 [Treponema sp.]|nr:hypothetical protein [Treponema sp.]
MLCINGCCYGKDNNPDKGSYYKYCGQAFWEFIGGNANIYTDIIEPLGYKAKERNDDYMIKYSRMMSLRGAELRGILSDALFQRRLVR